MHNDTIESPAKLGTCGNAGKPKLLVVPHLYTETIRVREIELALRLTKHFDVYCLKWNDAFFAHSSSRLQERLKRVRVGLQSLVTKTKMTKGRNGITYVEIPLVQALVLKNIVGSRLAMHLAQKQNTRVLMDVTQKLGISHLLLASGHFRVPRANGVRIFYDIVDWFDEKSAPAWVLKNSRSALEAIARDVNLIFAVSSPLSQRLQATYGIASNPIPNGADLAALRSVPAKQIAKVRNRWRIKDKFVLGYIGNHESFAGVDFLIRVHQLLRTRMPDAVLFIVGPADYWKSKLRNSPQEGVIFTGSVSPSEISAYFNAVDIGMLAQAPNPGTNYAFQIKMVEYAASRKCAISTPLEVWKRMAWPNVSLVELDEEKWVEAIVKMRTRSWQSDWDRLAESYDWQVIADQMAISILNAPAVAHA